MANKEVRKELIRFEENEKNTGMSYGFSPDKPYSSICYDDRPFGSKCPDRPKQHLSGLTPEIQAEGAVVIDAATGQVLYGKNEKTRFYPASTTKLMTALLVLERCRLNDTVTFSKTATTNLEAGAVSLNITEGDKLTVEQSLYALLLKSANEVANGLAEHVAGRVSGFADVMNQKAAALGCTGTHFVNPNGLNDTNHYTTPYDMALIARAAFQNETLCKINTTLSYNLPAVKNSPARTITMGHKMMYPTDSRYYKGIIGGKTGYTSKAGNTLVTGAERNGVRLVAVIMKSSATHYADTKALLDYGFAKMGVGTDSQTNVSQPVTSSGGNVVSPVTNPSQTTATGWLKDQIGWYYIKSDGKKAAGEWLELSDGDYWIDSNGYMAPARWSWAGSRSMEPGITLAPAALWQRTGGHWIMENGFI